MGVLQTVRMPGQVWGVVAPNRNGPLFVTSYRSRDLFTTVLTAVDLSGRVLWQREFDGHPGPPRVSGAGNVWIAHRGPEGDLLCELDASGTVQRSIMPQHEPGEYLGRVFKAGLSGDVAGHGLVAVACRSIRMSEVSCR
jgi:hypothetical protein